MAKNFKSHGHRDMKLIFLPVILILTFIFCAFPIGCNKTANKASVSKLPPPILKNASIRVSMKNQKQLSRMDYTVNSMGFPTIPGTVTLPGGSNLLAN